MTKVSSPVNLKLFISPTLDYRVAERKTFFGRHFQQVSNVCSMTLVKINRTYGWLSGQGWINNKKLHQKLSSELPKNYDNARNILKFILEKNCLRVKITPEKAKKICTTATFTLNEDEYKKEAQELLKVVSLLNRIKMDRKLVSQLNGTSHSFTELDANLQSAKRISVIFSAILKLENDIDSLLKEVDDIDNRFENTPMILDPKNCQKIRMQWLTIQCRKIAFDKYIYPKSDVRVKYMKCQIGVARTSQFRKKRNDPIMDALRKVDYTYLFKV